MEQISSRKSSLVAHIRKLLSSRKYRREMGEMVCEGPKMLEEALKWRATITTVLVEQGRGLPTELPESLRKVEVPKDLLSYLSDTETPQGLLFLCRIPKAEVPPTLERGHYLVLDGLQDPGNVGTIWRTADALGAKGLFLLPGCADPWSPKTLRSSMGACFRFPLWEMELGPLGECLAQADIPLLATALDEKTKDLRSIQLDLAAVVIGSEGKGVSPEVLAACEATVKIPMGPRCESLNAAVAASIVLWEMGRTSL